MLYLCDKVSIPNESWGGDWERAQDERIAQMSAFADKLVAACAPPAPEVRPTFEAVEALEERDHKVLGALVKLCDGPFKARGGPWSSHWKSFCLQTQICARRAWETSSQRLLRLGLVRQVGRRWQPVEQVANTPPV